MGKDLARPIAVGGFEQHAQITRFISAVRQALAAIVAVAAFAKVHEQVE